MQIPKMVVLKDADRRIVKILQTQGASDAAHAVSPADVAPHTKWQPARVREELRALAARNLVLHTQAPDGTRYYLAPRSDGNPPPVGAGRIPPW